MSSDELYKEDSDLEAENLYGNGCFDEAEIVEPFDPRDVDIISNTMQSFAGY